MATISNLDSDNPFQPPQTEWMQASSDRAQQYRAASRSSRFGGAVVDGLCKAGVAIAGVVLAALLGSDVDGGQTGGLVIGVAGLGLLVLAIFNWFLIARDGQSIGKKAAGTRIVMNDSGELPGFGRGVALRSWLPALIGAVPLVGPLFNLLDILWIFGSEKRCLHDLIAGTRVIEIGAVMRRRLPETLDVSFES